MTHLHQPDEPAPPSRLALAAVGVILLALIAAALAFTVDAARATATATAPTRHMYVHDHHGQWAWEPPNHPRDIRAPSGSVAHSKMMAAAPGDVFRLRGESRGRFRVTGIIDITVAKAARPFYDRRMHPGATSRYLFLDRVRS